MNETAQQKPLKVWVTPQISGIAAMKNAQDAKANNVVEDGLGDGPTS